APDQSQGSSTRLDLSANRAASNLPVPGPTQRNASVVCEPTGPAFPGIEPRQMKDTPTSSSHSEVAERGSVLRCRVVVAGCTNQRESGTDQAIQRRAQ